ncbi:Mediator complex, subunit Med6 [Penicillium griseofulvum]|uniref:Mediator of RNA polymerase II transcription subunit 6 n=1 Tax=Penicillium patulum TaxID=5078 RepID=A0A135LQK2_PENPA|nr:Mediator complex, subunit Med6 [Penicillium griseofulvum]KXG51222.1 Mediator complex, subunit Med6 [Penicillium griseofulvum]
MASQDASMEEILWRSPPHVQMMGGFLHSNNILFYFAESPFFDSTSNNASLAIQANYNDAFRHFVETREAFEARLKTMQGLEFIVSYDPLQAAAQTDNRFAHEPSNIWVIRKQNRRKRSGMDDEVTVISTYFIVGDCIYMAPSVAGVVGNRILSAVTSLTQLMKSAATLPTFTASHGHTYLPPGVRSKETAGTTSQASQSKEATPMPDVSFPTTESSQSAGKSSLGSSATGSSFQDTRSLAESFSLLTRYGDEFMDESPLVGEPGSFILSRTGGEATGTAAKAVPKIAATAAATGTPSALPVRASTPQVRVETPGKASDKSSSPPSSAGDKSKRKKSRIVS